MRASSSSHFFIADSSPERGSDVARFSLRPRWSSRYSRLPCKPHIRREDIPTTVPHSGRESSRRAAPLCKNGAFVPGRTTATPPWIRVPAPRGSPGLTSEVDHHAGFMTAPSGTTPWVANRHNAIRSRRAIVTTITLRMRRPFRQRAGETNRLGQIRVGSVARARPTRPLRFATADCRPC
jgi:hypothetical protein